MNQPNRPNELPNPRARLGEVYEVDETTGVHKFVGVIDVQEAVLQQLEKKVGYSLPILRAQLNGDPIVLEKENKNCWGGEQKLLGEENKKE